MSGDSLCYFESLSETEFQTPDPREDCFLLWSFQSRSCLCQRPHLLQGDLVSKLCSLVILTGCGIVKPVVYVLIVSLSETVFVVTPGCEKAAWSGSFRGW